MKFGITRRALLAGLPPLGAAELRRFRDPATEFDVVRLTDPAHPSWISASHLRAISQRDSFLLFASTRTGTMQPYRMDLRANEIEPLSADAEAVDEETLGLLPGDRQFCYAAGGEVKVGGFGRSRPRSIYTVENGWKRGPGFSIAADGRHVALVEQQDSGTRVRLIGVRAGAPATVVTDAAVIDEVRLNPKRASLLYRKGGTLWNCGYDGSQNRALRTPSEGKVESPLWSKDGRAVTYLFVPDERTRLIELRETVPDSNEDKLISRTSQFVSLAVNGDGSVFGGASMNKASPHVLLLLRSTRREFTLCEHHASDPRRVNVRFSPSSQKLLFQSDKEGGWAIYSMAVDRLIEKTEEE